MIQRFLRNSLVILPLSTNRPRPANEVKGLGEDRQDVRSDNPKALRNFVMMDHDPAEHP